MIFFDHNATTTPWPAAADAAAAWLRAGPANASSVHAAGRRARAAIEAARRQVAQALGATAADLVFTSGATEALHLAILGRVPAGGHVVASAVEHPAVFGACAVAGARVTRVPVDGEGRLAVADVLAAIEPRTALVAVMAAQNEIGTIFPVADIARAVAPVPVLCDAVQAWGKVPLDVRALGCALAVVSGHKIGAPSGVGVLWAPRALALRPTLAGGPQERGRRAGTENLPAIVGLGVAATEAVAASLTATHAVAARRARLRAALTTLPGLRFHGAAGGPADMLPNTLAFRVDGLPGDELLQALDLEGICLSSGSACAAGALEPSSVLRALGLATEEARGGLRLSLGRDNTDAEVERFIDVFPRLVARARAARAEGRACA